MIDIVLKSDISAPDEAETLVSQIEDLVNACLEYDRFRYLEKFAECIQTLQMAGEPFRPSGTYAMLGITMKAYTNAWVHPELATTLCAAIGVDRLTTIEDYYGDNVEDFVDSDDNSVFSGPPEPEHPARDFWEGDWELDFPGIIKM
jgi:hypothetical protein